VSSANSFREVLCTTKIAGNKRIKGSEPLNAIPSQFHHVIPTHERMDKNCSLFQIIIIVNVYAY